ncbi:hypothetical protein M0R45_022850 [Rubus argutus]|uniref:Uncharacterized protein n=1 Tax=Rubus argutus TaxID=59490 RepID=A0AAW1XG08_RUBAR
MGTKPVPTVASFSSRGSIRPGCLILGAWGRKAGIVQHDACLAWRFQSNVTAHPQWSPVAIKSAIMTTANVLDNKMEPIRDSGYKLRTATPWATKHLILLETTNIKVSFGSLVWIEQNAKHTVRSPILESPRVGNMDSNFC